MRAAGALRVVHAWSGAVLSLILAVLGITGALLVFEDDWIRLSVPEARAEALTTPAALAGAAARAEAAFGPELQTVVFGREGLAVHKAYLADGGAAYLAGDGRVIARWSKNGRVEDWLFGLHHELLAGETGELLGGVAGLAGALLTLSGLYVWWPARRSFSLEVLPPSGRRADLIGSHRNLGVLIAAPLLLLSVTGSGMVFHDQTRALLVLAFRDAPEPPGPKPLAGPGPVDWPRALAAAQSAYPHAQLRMVVRPSEPGRPLTVRLRQPREWHPNGRTTVLLDPAAARVLHDVDAMAGGAGARAANAVYPLHAASVGGRLYDGVSLLAGMGLGALGLVGAWAFLRKPRRRRAPSAAALAATPAE